MKIVVNEEPIRYHRNYVSCLFAENPDDSSHETTCSIGHCQHEQCTCEDIGCPNLVSIVDMIKEYV